MGSFFCAVLSVKEFYTLPSQYRYTNNKFESGLFNRHASTCRAILDCRSNLDLCSDLLDTASDLLDMLPRADHTLQYRHLQGLDLNGPQLASLIRLFIAKIGIGSKPTEFHQRLIPRRFICFIDLGREVKILFRRFLLSVYLRSHCQDPNQI